MHAAIVRDHTSLKPYLLDLGLQMVHLLVTPRTKLDGARRKCLKTAISYVLGLALSVCVASIGVPVSSSGHQGGPTTLDDTNVQQKRPHSKMESEGADIGRMEKLPKQKGGRKGRK